MGSFTSTAPDTSGAKAAPAALSHADQIQGAAPTTPAPAPAPLPQPGPAPAMPDYSHADQIMGASVMPGSQPDFRIDPDGLPDPSNSPWLNPPGANGNVLDPFGGAGGTDATAASAAPGGGNLPAPPPLPQKPASASTPKPGLAGRVPGTDGQTPIYRPNELEGGGNTAESADYVQKKNADAAKLAETEARVEAHHAEGRVKVARERQKTAERVWRRHAEETADAQKAQVAQRQKLAKALTTKVKQLMEPADHPGMSDDAKIVQAARRAALSAEAAASNDRQAKALGKIGGVGDPPVYTADAAENYGDTGIDEVADLIHRTAATDLDKGKQLLDQTTARLSDAKAEQLKQTVAGYALSDGQDRNIPKYTGVSDNSRNAVDAIKNRLVAEAQKVLGIDKNLLERSGKQASTVVGLVGVYEILSDSQRDKLLRQIGVMENSDSGRELATKLRGHIAYKKMLGETTYSTANLAKYRDQENRFSDGLKDAASLSRRVEIAIPLMLGSLIIGEDAKAFDEKLKNRQGDDH